MGEGTTTVGKEEVAVATEVGKGRRGKEIGRKTGAGTAAAAVSIGGPPREEAPAGVVRMGVGGRSAGVGFVGFVVARLEVGSGEREGRSSSPPSLRRFAKLCRSRLTTLLTTSGAREGEEEKEENLLGEEGEGAGGGCPPPLLLLPTKSPMSVFNREEKIRSSSTSTSSSIHSFTSSGSPPTP